MNLVFNINNIKRPKKLECQLKFLMVKRKDEN